MKIWCAVSRTGDAAMETSKSASLTLTGNTSGPRANAGRNWKPNQDYVRRTLEEGARKARETASVVLDRVRRAVGLA